MTRLKHYHAINGNIGCLPDSNEIFFNLDDSIDHLCDMFYETEDLESALYDDGIYYSHLNPNNILQGAEYCEIVECYEAECLTGYDYE